MGKRDFEVWLVAEQLKVLERDGKAGFVQHIKLKKKYRELTGRDWECVPARLMVLSAKVIWGIIATGGAEAKFPYLRERPSGQFSWTVSGWTLMDMNRGKRRGAECNLQNIQLFI